MKTEPTLKDLDEFIEYVDVEIWNDKSRRWFARLIKNDAPEIYVDFTLVWLYAKLLEAINETP